TDPAKMVISPTDPEAAIGRDKRGVFRPLYNAQLVADLDSNLILGYEAFAQQNDNGLLPILLKRTQQLLGHKLRLALVDAGYTGGQERALAEQARVTTWDPAPGRASSRPRPGSSPRAPSVTMGSGTSMSARKDRRSSVLARAGRSVPVW